MMRKPKKTNQQANKQVKETIQNMKIERKSIKKTQIEGIQGIQSLDKQTGNTGTNITNRIHEMEERISASEDPRHKIDSSVNEKCEI